MQLHRGVESPLSGGTQRIPNSQRTGSRRSVAVSAERRVAENTAGDIEALPKKFVRFGGASLRDNRVGLRDSRTLGGKGIHLFCGAALFFESRRGWGISRSCFPGKVADGSGRIAPRHLHPAYGFSRVWDKRAEVASDLIPYWLNRSVATSRGCYDPCPDIRGDTRFTGQTSKFASRMHADEKVT